jgi:acyl-CoA synthetase (AMP-forming)/AMP-acid ligase II
MVHAGPLTHGSGSKVLGILGMGGANVTLDRFRPESFAEAVRANAGSHTFLVPTMLQRLVNASPEVHESVRSMRQITVGGAPISPDSFRKAIESFGPILTQIYGASEAPHPLTLLRPDDYAEDLSDDLLRSAGFPAPSVSVKILAPEGGEVADGTVGELVVRAPSVMMGYWRRDEATADVLDKDGWYHTGDLVSRGPSGAITFQDRKRDLVITGGMNVYPAEVERVLDEHPDVVHSAVLGYPDEEWGESLAAFVVKVPGSDLDAAGVQDWVRSRVAGYKKPRRVEFLDELPMGSTNKVVKGPLRDMFWAGHDRRV